MSNWASPIVIVPKKSTPRVPPERRLCIDFRKVNELQQEVLAEGKKRGQISLHPLPKIDEMYAKLKGAKVFSTINLRSRYYHIALGKDSRAKTAFVMPFGMNFLWSHLVSSGPCLLSTVDEQGPRRPELHDDIS